MEPWLKAANLDIKIFAQDVAADLEDLADKLQLDHEYVVEKFKSYLLQMI